MSHDHHPSLANLTRLAAGRGVLLAAALAAYQQREQLDDGALAALLECSHDGLVRLRLCEVPRADHFDEDVTKIAAYAPVERDALVQLLKRAGRAR